MKSLMRLWAFSLIVTYFATLLLPAVALAVTAPFPTCRLSISPSVIAVGGSATLTWTSTNATAGAITNVGNVAPSGSKQILPPTTSQITTYLGSFTGPGGTANCTASVQISYGTVTGGTDTITGASTDIVTPNPLASNTGGSAGAQSQLVQCGLGSGAANYLGATSCQACNLAQLVQNLINFAIGLSIPIAAGLFAWAGILYFTSGASQGNIEKAKGIFSNALIGFVIAITGWLVVNTLLHALLDGGKAGFTNGNWFTIQCDTTARPIAVVGGINAVINSVLTPVNTNAPVAVGSAYVCSNGTILNGNCVDPNNPNIILGTPTLQNSANYAGLNCPAGSSQAGSICASDETGLPIPPIPSSQGIGDCSAANLADNFDTDFTAMSCIAQKESGCNSTPLTSADKTTSGAIVSQGIFQVNMTNHQVQCDNINGGQMINCPAAFSGSYTGSHKNVAVVDQSLYNQCAAALQNPDCNMQVAQGILNTEGLQAWSTAVIGNPNSCNLVSR